MPSPALQKARHEASLDDAPGCIRARVLGEREPVPWIETSKGRTLREDREDTIALNKRDWIDCIRSRRWPLSEVEDGHHVAISCNFANMFAASRTRDSLGP